MTVAWDEAPSPQYTVTVCESNVPGSVKLPLRVTKPPSSIMLAPRFMLKLEGTALFTVTAAVAVSASPSASAIVMATVKVSVGVPVG